MKEIIHYSIKTISSFLIVSLLAGCSSYKKDRGTADNSAFSPANTSEVIPLPKAFAHNDYAHEKPLFDALANGFTVIEADIHLIDGELYVTHDPPASIEEVSTLRELYLQPLSRLVKENEGYIYPGYEVQVYLMIDFKTEAESTYAVLRNQLVEFSDILSSPSDTGAKPKPVKVFISGNRPVQTILEDSVQLASVDGRPSDLAKNYSPDFMPIISENITSLINWNRVDPIPEEEIIKLKTLSAEIHLQGKKFRPWAVPEDEYMWEILLDAGMDFVCSDDLEKARIFLTEKGYNNPKN